MNNELKVGDLFEREGEWRKVTDVIVFDWGGKAIVSEPATEEEVRAWQENNSNQ